MAVAFDLWIISFSLLMGAAFALKREKQGKLVGPIATSIFVLLFIIASLAFSSVLPRFHQLWFRIWIPDLLGFALVGYAAHVSREEA